MSGGRKSGPSVPEHRRRERGQVQFHWRTSEALLDQLRQVAEKLRLTPGEFVTRAVERELKR